MKNNITKEKFYTYKGKYFSSDGKNLIPHTVNNIKMTNKLSGIQDLIKFKCLSVHFDITEEWPHQHSSWVQNLIKSLRVEGAFNLNIIASNWKLKNFWNLLKANSSSFL